MEWSFVIGSSIGLRIFFLEGTWPGLPLALGGWARPDNGARLVAVAFDPGTFLDVVSRLGEFGDKDFS